MPLRRSHREENQPRRARGPEDGDRTRVAPSDLEAAAEELGLDPADLSKDVEKVREQRELLRQTRPARVLALPALLSFLAFSGLLAFGAAQWAWIAGIVFASSLPFALIGLVTAGRRGYAPGWRVRCPGCGRSRAAADVGITRIGASGTKRILANCRECGGFRWVVLERVPEEGLGR